ncbi:MAG: patatin-like phospholipase family protein [Acidobacteriaceae bacterium]|nr:patatin-like phospholipase family protein [Acidobacteriaceae bacterium]
MIGQLRRAAGWLDDQVRFADIRWQRLGADGHNIDAWIWPSLVAAALWTGMPRWGWRLAVGWVVGLAAYALFRAGRRHLLVTQVAALGLLGAGIWWFGPDQAPEGGGVYRHLLIPVTAGVGVVLLVAAQLARVLVGPLAAGSTYAQGLRVTELFQSRGRTAPAEGRALLWQLITGLSGGAGLLLLPAAVAVLVAPPAYTGVAGVAVLGGMGLLVVFTALNERLYAMVRILTVRCFRNAALGVSLLLMALGAARMAGVSYVTTVFDGATGLEIVLFLGYAYAITWWYDYWTERLVGQELLGVLGGGGESTEIPYLYEGPAVTRVPADQRALALHGLGRFVAYRPNGELPYFEAWSFRDLFVHLAATGNPGGKAEPKPRRIDRRLSQYFGSVGLLAAVLLGGGMWWLSLQTQIPGLVAASGPGNGKRLAELVGCGGGPRILVAASGGGTRAALFTAAVLEGITQRAPAGSIVAGSGVSGGSAALAYYAGRRPELLVPEVAAWDRFHDKMSEPYIADVIDRASEWRMVKGGRLGILLAESFERRWALGARQRMGEVGDFGLMLNTTLAGRFAWAGQEGGLTLAEAASARLGETRSEVAGGRLVLTNLALREAFPRSALPFVAKDPLPVLVDDPATPLEKAAALSANFPPVFSNAAVDVGGRDRYWVTDGGAADNRGLEMLLYALRAKTLPCAVPPEVHVVVIEASGLSGRYSQDRGIGSAMGAGAQFAGQLNVELARQLPGVRFHLVAMPEELRKAESFGTHWMLQPSIAVRTKAGEEVFGGVEVVRALRGSYGCRAGAAPERLRALITESPEFREGWCSLERALRGRGCLCEP